jgi:hypothetical protein
MRKIGLPTWALGNLQKGGWLTSNRARQILAISRQQKPREQLGHTSGFYLIEIQPDIGTLAAAHLGYLAWKVRES